MLTSEAKKKRKMADYRSLVRVALGRQSEEYKLFLYIFKEWERKRITAPVVAALYKLLFSDRQGLIKRFNQFLPAQYKISLPLARRPNVGLKEAVGFVAKVKAALDKEHYISFLHILNGYRKATMSLLEVARKVCDLLQDRQDLLLKFANYLPAPLKAANLNASIDTNTGKSSQ